MRPFPFSRSRCVSYTTRVTRLAAGQVFAELFHAPSEGGGGDGKGEGGRGRNEMKGSRTSTEERL
jgi:hypothetical protein